MGHWARDERFLCHAALVVSPVIQDFTIQRNARLGPVKMTNCIEQSMMLRALEIVPTLHIGWRF